MNNVDESLIVVIPALNEEQTIGDVVASVRALHLPVVVVDDHSSDLTAEKALRAGAIVLRLPIHLGVGGALRTGFRFAKQCGYRSVVQLDADGQHPVAQIMDLVSAADSSGAHLVIGSRYLSSDSTLHPTLVRRLSMWCLSQIASTIASTRITDTSSGFRIIREPLLTQLAANLPDYYLGDTFEAAVASARAGYQVLEIPAALRPRTFGQSSTSSWKAVLLVCKVLFLAVTNLHPQLRQFNQEADGR